MNAILMFLYESCALCAKASAIIGFKRTQREFCIIFALSLSLTLFYGKILKINFILLLLRCI